MRFGIHDLIPILSDTAGRPLQGPAMRGLQKLCKCRTDGPLKARCLLGRLHGVLVVRRRVAFAAASASECGHRGRSSFPSSV